MSVFCKVDGNWEQAIRIYKKENDAWGVISSSAFTDYISLCAPVYGGDVTGTTGPIVVPDAYNPSGTHEPNSDYIYEGSPGSPNVVTDENGKVVEYTFTDTGTTGVTVSNVDTGIIAFDSGHPGFNIHLVVEFTPSASTESNPIISANVGNSQSGLTIYTYSSYLYCKLKLNAYDTNGYKYKVWSYFSPSGNDTNYYKTRNTVTIDATFSHDKKFTLVVNGKATDYTDYSYTLDMNNVTIKAGVGISNFTIKEFSVTK